MNITRRFGPALCLRIRSMDTRPRPGAGRAWQSSPYVGACRQGDDAFGRQHFGPRLGSDANVNPVW